MNEVSEAKKIKYLVVDDEIAAKQQYQQVFINDIAIQDSSALFAGNCAEALSMIRQNSDILFCFLDCKLPKNEAGLLNYSPQDDIDTGIELIPKISQIEQDFPIIVFSEYVNKAQLQKKANRYSSNIIDCLNKNDSSKRYREAAIKALDFRSISIRNLPADRSTSENIKAKQDLSFDYEQLTLETQLMLKDRAKEIKKLLKRTGQDISDIGKYLTEVKKNLKHGQFYAWLKIEFNWSLTSAFRFMKVYEKFKSFNLADLSIAPSALYELTNNSIPDEALLEIIELSNKGEFITVELARSFKKKYQKEGKEEEANTSLGKISLETENNTSKDKKTDKDDNSQELASHIKDGVLDRDKEGVISLKQDIVKVISPQRIWYLGDRKQHVIMCQDPNSKKFIEQLPSSIALCLAFPPSLQWQFNYDHCKSMMTFYSEYQDLDEVALLKSIQYTIEITTEEKNVIAVCFMPSLEILSMINTLGCRAVIAEPDRDKCLALVAKNGKKA